MKNKLTHMLKWIRNGQRIIWLEYSTLALAVLFPVLLPGYVLTLDLVFTPHASWPLQLTNTYPMEVVLWLVYHVLPGDVIEKIILFLILLFSGAGMHILIRSLRPADISASMWQLAAYFAGIFYMINPYTYSRFMAGQWMVLLGYALLPFFVRWVWQCFRQPSKKSAIFAAFCASGIIAVSLHHSGIVLVIIGLVVATGSIVYCHKRKLLWTFFGCMGLMGAIIVGVSSYWLISALRGEGSIGYSVAHFNEAHFAAFATAGGNMAAAIGQVVRLQGFWAEARHLYTLPQALVPLWGVIFLLLWGLIGYGGLKAWQKNRAIACVAFGSILLGVVFAATPLLAWISQIIPWVGGYREPHKFTNLIALGYGVLGAYGVAYFVKRARERWGATRSKIIACVVMILPLVITPVMLWGFGGQLAPRVYPKDWRELNTTLKDAVPPGKRALILPWHQYAIYSFSGGRIIANPAEKFFEFPSMISNNPEFNDLPPTTPNEDKRRIEELLRQPENSGQTLKQLAISHVVVLKEQDFTKYHYLNGARGLQQIGEGATFILYKVGGTDGN